MRYFGQRKHIYYRKNLLLATRVLAVCFCPILLQSFCNMPDLLPFVGMINKQWLTVTKFKHHIPFEKQLTAFVSVRSDNKNDLSLDKSKNFFSMYLLSRFLLQVLVACISGNIPLQLISVVCPWYIMRAAFTVKARPRDLLLIVCLSYSTTRLMSRFYGTIIIFIKTNEIFIRMVFRFAMIGVIGNCTIFQFSSFMHLLPHGQPS